MRKGAEAVRMPGNPAGKELVVLSRAAYSHSPIRFSLHAGHGL